MPKANKNKWESVSNSFELLVTKQLQEQMINDMQKMENDFWNLIPKFNARNKD